MSAEVESAFEQVSVVVNIEDEVGVFLDLEQDGVRQGDFLEISEHSVEDFVGVIESKLGLNADINKERFLRDASEKIAELEQYNPGFQEDFLEKFGDYECLGYLDNVFMFYDENHKAFYLADGEKTLRLNETLAGDVLDGINYKGSVENLAHIAQNLPY